jgi:hypothetical protein
MIAVLGLKVLANPATKPATSFRGCRKHEPELSHLLRHRVDVRKPSRQSIECQKEKLQAAVRRTREI